MPPEWLLVRSVIHKFQRGVPNSNHYFFFAISGASAALASERARLRDRLIRMEYLAAETNLGPEDKEKFIRRRMNKAYCRRSRRYTEKREGRRESELLKALESSMNKERNAAVAAAAAVASASAASNMPNASSSG